MSEEHRRSDDQERLDAIRSRALEQARIGFLRYALDGKVLFIDRITLEVLQLEGRYSDPSELLGKNIDELHQHVSPEETWLRNLVLSEGRLLGQEQEFLTLDGNWKCIRHDSYLVKDPKTGDQAIQVMLRDVTEVRSTERKLIERKEWFRALFDKSLHAVFVHDFEGRFLDANDAALRLLGYRRDEIRQLSFKDLLDEQDLPVAFATMQEIQQNGRQLELSEYRLRRRNGTYVWVESEASLIHREGRPFAILGIAVDLTDRKRTEVWLQRSLEQFVRFTSVVSDVIYRYDRRQKRYDFVTPSFERLTGYTLEELTRDPQAMTRKLIPEPDLVRITRAAVKHEEQGPGAGPLTLEYPMVHREGHRIWVSETMDYEFSEDGSLTHISGILRDVTEGRKADAERERLILELEAKNRELDGYAHSVSHDLKSPLITIKGYLGAFLEDLAQERSDAMEEDVQRIARATDHMAELLERLLDLSRSGQLIRPLRRIPLDSIVTEVLERIQGLIKDCGAEVHVAPDLPEVTGDPRRLGEVVQNLLENAVKFMGDQPRPRIEIGVREGDPPTVFVRDNGIGIDPRHQESIFGVFHRLDPETSGTGMGLALARRIMEVHGGKLWVESEGEGRGATFLLTLPE